MRPQHRTATLAAACTAALLAGAATDRLRLAGVTLGAPVQDVVKLDGPPGFVATTDDGIEWRWFDAAGIDVDLLTDETFVVRQVLVARPQAIHGIQAKLVEPPEFPLLGLAADAAGQRMLSTGARRLPEPENTVSAWRLSQDVLVLELGGGTVQQVLALDDNAAARWGYIQGTRPAQFHAPRLLREYAVDYPKRALEQHAEGVAVVAVDLSATGAVTGTRIVVSSGNADIDAAEMLSMRRSKFEAARCDGAPCPSVYVDREEYSLDP